MLYFIAYNLGFVKTVRNSGTVHTPNVRLAKPFHSFKEADDTARNMNIKCYAVLSNVTTVQSNG